MDGVFLETGPFRINKDQTLKPFYGSWNEYANVLYGRQQFHLLPIFFIRNYYLTFTCVKFYFKS